MVGWREKAFESGCHSPAAFFMNNEKRAFRSLSLPSFSRVPGYSIAIFPKKRQYC